jgi:Domain of unknown function (DUF4396)
MAPAWLQTLAAASLALALLCAAISIVLLFMRPQKMWIMDLVWPITMLYWGPIGLWGLWVMGTPSAGSIEDGPLPGEMEPSQARTAALRAEKGPAGSSKRFWQQVAIAVTHCGAGCTLGDILGEWLLRRFQTGSTVARTADSAAERSKTFESTLR